MVGPASLAGDTQIAWHEIIEAQRPNGWVNQLRNEPIVQLRYDVALRWPEEDGGHADVIARVRGHAGNAAIAAEGEVAIRIGWNLPGVGVEAIPLPLMDVDAGAVAPAEAGPSRRGWLGSGNLLARAGLKVVAHNIFLAGNTFANNDIRISRTPLVPELAAGLELNLVGNFWLSFQFVHRGSEFETWSGRNAPAQQFGSFTLALVDPD